MHLYDFAYHLPLLHIISNECRRCLSLVLRTTETAAENNPTGTSIACVSKAVHKWTTPIIYHAIVLYDRDSITFLSRTLQSPNTHKAGARIHSLFLHSDLSETYHNAAAILCASTRLDCLVTEYSFINLGFRRLKPKLAYCDDGHSGTVPQNHPLMRNAMHLYLDLTDSYVLESIQFLPRPG